MREDPSELSYTGNSVSVYLLRANDAVGLVASRFQRRLPFAGVVTAALQLHLLNRADLLAK